MYINLQNTLSNYITYSLHFNFIFAYVLYVVYYLLLFKTKVTLKMDIKMLQKQSILCYEVVVGNYNKLKQIFKEYRNNRIVY